VLGQYRLALDFLNQGTATAADSDNRDGIARSLSHKADLSNLVGSFTDSITYATRSMELYREQGDLWREAAALTMLMDALSRLGRGRDPGGHEAPVDQQHTHGFLELLDPGGQRRLGHAAGLGRAAEMPLARQRQKEFQLIDQRTNLAGEKA